jgi:hypothetical protein
MLLVCNFQTSSYSSNEITMSTVNRRQCRRSSIQDLSSNHINRAYMSRRRIAHDMTVIDCGSTNRLVEPVVAIGSTMSKLLVYGARQSNRPSAYGSVADPRGRRVSPGAWPAVGRGSPRKPRAFGVRLRPPVTNWRLTDQGHRPSDARRRITGRLAG